MNYSQGWSSASAVLQPWPPSRLFMSTKEKDEEDRSRQFEDDCYVGGEKDTFAVQLGLQLLVLVGEFPVHQEKFVVQLSPFGRARLERGSVSIICEDSRRVIFT